MKYQHEPIQGSLRLVALVYPLLVRGHNLNLGGDEMNLSKVQSFVRVGSDHIAVDAQERVVGVIRMLDKQIHINDETCLRIDSRRFEDGCNRIRKKM